MTQSENVAMTVTELIEQLQKLPADLPVYLADWSEGYAQDFQMTIDNGPIVVAMEPGMSTRSSLPERVVLGERKP
jgi:hypothetical protein